MRAASKYQEKYDALLGIIDEGLDKKWGLESILEAMLKTVGAVYYRHTPEYNQPIVQVLATFPNSTVFAVGVIEDKQVDILPPDQITTPCWERDSLVSFANNLIVAYGNVLEKHPIKGNTPEYDSFINELNGLKPVHITAYPYATVEGDIYVPKDINTKEKLDAYIIEHFNDIRFGTPDLDYAGTDFDTECEGIDDEELSL